MVIASLPGRILSIFGTIAIVAFSGYIAIDTIRTINSSWSPLPWFDEWATTNLVGAWQDGDITIWQLLFSQHNEHRILVPRLFFLTDDVLFGRAGRMTMWSIFLVQLLHAGLFAFVLGQSRPVFAGRWAIGATVMAMMFSLHQGENFSSGFQLQFVSVFAGATLCFVIFSRTAVKELSGNSSLALQITLLLSMLITVFTMTNGLIVPYIVFMMSLVMKLSRKTIILYFSFLFIITTIYLYGYKAVAHHSSIVDAIRQPSTIVVYALAYLGNIVSRFGVYTSIAFGCIGVIATGCAVFQTLMTREPRYGSLAMICVMIFIMLTAAVTASGRLNFGIEQALSSRYVTGSVAFWSSQIVYWWVSEYKIFNIFQKTLHKISIVQICAISVSIFLLISISFEQNSYKQQIFAQKFAQSHASDALLIGLYDPEAMRRTSWMDDDGTSVVDILRRNHLSVFSTPDAERVGHSISEAGTVSGACRGDITSAIIDPSIGQGGVKVTGSISALIKHGHTRRVFLADENDRVIGLATSGVPDLGLAFWSGYAVASLGAHIQAYELLGDSKLCLVGDRNVSMK